jgi:hypothetical protein
VGSIGLGGLQALGGAVLLWWALQLRGPSTGTLCGAAAAWIVPGVLLAASGVGVTSGARWGRSASLAAVLAGALAVSLVALGRLAVPPAMADAVEYVLSRPEAKGDLAQALRRHRPVESLRDPALVPVHAWTFTAYCGCPVLPWYLTVLFACGGPWARRLSRE